MSTSEKLHEQRSAAEKFVRNNVTALCQELVSLDETGLYGDGKLNELRTMCSFAGTSSQALAKGMVEMAAVRLVAAQGDASREELLRAMDAWGRSAFVIDEGTITFMNFFIRERANPANQWKLGR